MNAQAVVERMEQPEVVTGNALTPMDMVGRAVASGASIEVVEKLMALHERWEANQGRKAFDEAMAAAKAEIPVIFKSREVDFTSTKGRTHYRYEDLAEIAKTINPILSKHGLSYRFRTTSPANEPVSVTCIVSHRLGYSEENTLSAGRDESGALRAEQVAALRAEVEMLKADKLRRDGASGVIHAILRSPVVGWIVASAGGIYYLLRGHN